MSIASVQQFWRDSTMDKETIYDDEIAPLLLEAARIAHEHEIDFVAGS